MVRQYIGFIILMFLSLFVDGQSPSSSFFDENEIEIEDVDFNTLASDFGPSFVGNELWFSAYTKRHVKKVMAGRIKRVYYALFKTPVDTIDFSSTEPRILIRDLKNDFHEGPVSYCETTGELFVTMSNTVQIDVEEEGIIVTKQQIRLRLVIYKNIEGKWTYQEELPFNDPFYSVGHPFSTPSGDTLFFTSNIDSLSVGGTDIFMSVRNDSIWGDPVTLSHNINTSGNEMFPFYHPSGMLIFASNNHPGNKGGLDLYVSDLESDGFGPVRPLNQFNTQYDDFGLTIHSSGKAGYFVSNRPGQTGDDDIYKVNFKNKTSKSGKNKVE